jgi:glycine/D-amino acid oxidase-like deaminating enzyme
VRNPIDYSRGRFPICIRHFDLPGLCSIFPIFDAPGVKMMIEQKTPFRNVIDFSADVRNRQQVREHALTLLEGFAGQILKSETCWYTLTPDGDFIIDRHPAYPQIVVCSACSGHGFKFAPVIGPMIADLAIDSERSQHWSMFSITRPALGGESLWKRRS